ncbi:MAG TPA: hypothetical protein VMZ71_06355 [Gemmataceae bacterium]|nr:hypothetical protein [Gemmataceae bacterium]
MNLISFARRVAAVAVVLGAAGTSAAVDTPVAAPPVAHLAAVPCATCPAPAAAPCGPAAAACGPAAAACGPAWTGTKECRTHFGRPVPPYQTKLCPGACFGYFQTQWSKWEDVCPVPYQGQGFTDAPATRTTPVTPVRPPAEVKKPTDLKPADPKPMDPKPLDPKFNKDPKGGELPLPRPGGTGTNPNPMPMGRGTVQPIPAVPTNLPVPTGRFGS